jgi:hypothetical protein
MFLGEPGKRRVNLTYAALIGASGNPECVSYFGLRTVG